eukprot:GHVT01016286.1.p1 GENE.GHVT01016286.1~~GHVT01016286.1.p1  ORF type:complete len:120 (-),score=14.66 GHVT01016286.1:33-392(-)
MVMLVVVVATIFVAVPSAWVSARADEWLVDGVAPCKCLAPPLPSGGADAFSATATPAAAATARRSQRPEPSPRPVTTPSRAASTPYSHACQFGSGVLPASDPSDSPRFPRGRVNVCFPV